MGMLIMVGVLKAKAIATNLNSLIYWNFDLGVRTPELDVRTPELDVRTPELDVRTPELDVRTPDGLKLGPPMGH
jgi:hypothetical protein